MSSTDLAALIEQYRAALETKLERLVSLRSIAARQVASTEVHDIDALRLAGDQRDALTSELMAVEQQIGPVRERLTRERTARRLPGFEQAVGLERTIAATVQDILETDRVSIRALEHVVSDRRAATKAADQALATLAAYARMTAERPAAILVNRRG